MMPRVSSSSSSSSGPRRRLAAVLAVAVVGTAGVGVAALVQQQHHRPWSPSSSSSSSSSSSWSSTTSRTTTSIAPILPPPTWSSSSSSSRSRHGGGGGGGSRLHLGPVDDLSEYGRGKQTSELDTLVNKRDAIRKAKLANAKPDDDVPRLDDMSDEEIRLMLVTKEEEARGKEDDDDALFAMPDFKTRRSASNADRRGLSSGSYGGDVVGPGDAAVPSSSGEEGDDGESSSSAGMFVDWTADYDDENEFHVPNRIGFTTCDWGNVRGGYVDGKLKKKDRAAGRYNKSDLKVSEKMRERAERGGGGGGGGGVGGGERHACVDMERDGNGMEERWGGGMGRF